MEAVLESLHLGLGTPSSSTHAHELSSHHHRTSDEKDLCDHMTAPHPRNGGVSRTEQKTGLVRSLTMSSVIITDGKNTVRVQGHQIKSDGGLQKY